MLCFGVIDGYWLVTLKFAYFDHLLPSVHFKPGLREAHPQDWDPIRPRDRQLSQEYDPDNDDYEMRVIPEVNEIVELEESILIMNQIAKLENRIKMGGDFFFSGTSSWKFRSFFSF